MVVEWWFPMVQSAKNHHKQIQVLDEWPNLPAKLGRLGGKSHGSMDNCEYYGERTLALAAYSLTIPHIIALYNCIIHT